jgi:hypothetical protein
VIVPDIRHMPHGILPVIIPLTSPQDEVTRVINEIRQLAQENVPWRDFLLIHASREEVTSIIARLNNAFGLDTAVDPAQSTPDN